MTDTPETRLRKAADDIERKIYKREINPFAGLADQVRRIHPCDLALIVVITAVLFIGMAGGAGFCVAWWLMS